MERVKDYLLMEEEFIKNQERLKPQEEKQEVSHLLQLLFDIHCCDNILIICVCVCTEILSSH